MAWPRCAAGLAVAGVFLHSLAATLAPDLLAGPAQAGEGLRTHYGLAALLVSSSLGASLLHSWVRRGTR